jgi:hypothetical protein
MNIQELEEALTQKEQEPYYTLREKHDYIPEIHRIINMHNRRLSHIEVQASLYWALIKLKEEYKILHFLIDYPARFIQITYINGQVGTYTIYDG